LHFFLFGSDADFFDFGIFNDAKKSPWLLHQKAVDAVLLGFQLLGGLSENSLVERLLSIASKRRERASISLSERICYSGYTDGLQLFFYRT
jgi:hypothetical protein